MKQTSRQTNLIYGPDRHMMTNTFWCKLCIFRGRVEKRNFLESGCLVVQWRGMASLFHLWDPFNSGSLTIQVLHHPFQHLKLISIPLKSHYTFSWWLRLSSGFEFGELFFRGNFLRFLWHFKDRFHFKELFASFRPQRVRTTQTQKTQHALNFRHSTAF